ncbi:MAG TPA: ABC-F family ATP-binding cassette domain-containing protein [Aeromicrobium sp.]|nr:ABC-F family ATP-binding cassette domain-containing protein [Aeromicrobium sp.]
MSISTSVVLNDLTFTWPDGTAALTNIRGSFGDSRTGFIGSNGAGKSTLLKLIAGQLAPTAGTIVTTGMVDYLPQDLTRSRSTVADLLGISAIRSAIRQVEAGSTDQSEFDTIGDGWDVEDKMVAELAALGLPTDLDRPVSTLSGGEAMLIAITGVRLRGADIVLLDEPTNNLDRDARKQLYDLIGAWSGTLIIVSHDVELLDLMDETVELRAGELTRFGGNYSDYLSWLEVQQAAAAQSLRSAEQALKREKRERIKAEERIAHSERQGRKDRTNRKYVGMIVDKRRNAAEKSQGARRSNADQSVAGAKSAVEAAETQVRDDDQVQLVLPEVNLSSSKRLAELVSSDGRDFVIAGPMRVGLVGANGVGKTTLIETCLAQVTVKTAYLPQRIVLDDEKSVFETVREFAPNVTPAQLKNQLAWLLLRGATIARPVGSLSGGERFRVALARLLLADPPAELLVLDEPTNDLDLTSINQLVTALNAFGGALVVVSHDRRFLDRLELEVVLELDQDGTLSQQR